MKSANHKTLKHFSQNKKQIFVLVDPDKHNKNSLEKLTRLIKSSGIDGVLVGGSLITNNNFNLTVEYLKSALKIPVVLFPGSHWQLNPNADALLFLSLISGRNPELLIGAQVQAAHHVVNSGIESISTGYILIDGGKQTSASYISNSMPVPSDKPDLAAATALAGVLLGMKLIYLDAGSGAVNPVSTSIISTVKSQINVPLLVGGGIKTPEAAYSACKAGADIIVVGNALEQNPQIMKDLAKAVHKRSKT